MSELPARSTELAVDLICDWCGASDHLTGDHRERVVAIRILSDQRRWAEQAANGPAAGLLRFANSSYIGNTAASVATMAALFGGSVLIGGATSERLRQLAPTLGLLLGLIAGLVAGFWLARARMFRVLGPILAARPPVAEHAPARCRRCDGELAYSHRGIEPCPWCQAPNLASAELFNERRQSMTTATARSRRAARDNQRHCSNLATAAGSMITAASVAGAAVGYVAVELVL